MAARSRTLDPQTSMQIMGCAVYDPTPTDKTLLSAMGTKLVKLVQTPAVEMWEPVFQNVEVSARSGVPVTDMEGDQRRMLMMDPVTKLLDRATDEQKILFDQVSRSYPVRICCLFSHACSLPPPTPLPPPPHTCPPSTRFPWIAFCAGQKRRGNFQS